MLSVRIERDHAVESVLDGPMEAGLQRCTLTAIDFVSQDRRTGFLRHGAGAIGRAIVDDNNLRHVRRRRADDRSNRAFRVQGGNQSDDSLGHAASRDSTAETIPPPAESELTRT